MDMKKLLLISMLIGAMPLSMAAQDDDLYFVPKKKTEKVTDNYGMPKETYYAGSDRSIDEYNRRFKSSYEVIDGDSTASDIIDFSAEQGVYPDSIADDDYALTKQMSRFDDYDIANSSAFWAGYEAGRHSWGWHSPWYYSRFGWYGGWYDPWYDPWYYSSWRYGWYDPWYDPWYYGWGYYRYYGWGYPYHTVWYVGGGRLYANHYPGTMHRGNMNGRVYGRTGNYQGGRLSGAGSRLGSTRLGSLTNRSAGGHRTYNRGAGNSSRNVSGHSTFDRSSSYSRSSSSGGSFSGGSRSGGGGFSGGGGRSGGGHVGGRR